MVKVGSRRWVGGVLVGVAVVAAGCADEEILRPPSAEVVEDYYQVQGGVEARIVDGDVAEITVTQSARDLRRGGRLWAKVGPYIVLFSDDTRRLIKDHPGVRGVRITTHSSNGDAVASAFLHRNGLNDLEWKRALNVAGKARRDGTRKPTLLEDLVDWGEEHTEFEYSAKYID